MKKIFILLVLISPVFISCNSDDDSNSGAVTENLSVKNQINSFVYRALNTFYLYKDESPDLANNRFRSQSELDSFINQSGTPEAFFEQLTISDDRFSFIFNDFEVLENFFQGVTLSTGMKFNLNQENNSTNQYIVVTDVVSGSPADFANIQRGMVFNTINGSQINANNVSALFRASSFTLGEAEFDNNGNLINTTNEFSLNAIELTENPVAVTRVLTEDDHKIGYLQYNSFVFDFEEQLNNAFGQLKNEGVTDLVLDLRYNGGGAIITANALSGMITGQFEGQVFSKRQWNSDIQQIIQDNSPENLIDNFVSRTAVNQTPLNSLGLNKLYVITSKEQTASASELVINSLSTYIEVIVIGDPRGTSGKSQASNTFYDSEDFSRENNNPSHKYVVQPLIFRTTNSNNFSVSDSGITPSPGFEIVEDDRNLGILGDPNEPLLKLAIDDITGRSTRNAKTLNKTNRKILGNQSMYSPNYQRMYTDLVK